MIIDLNLIDPFCCKHEAAHFFCTLYIWIRLWLMNAWNIWIIAEFLLKYTLYHLFTRGVGSKMNYWSWIFIFSSWLPIGNVGCATLLPPGRRERVPPPAAGKAGEIYVDTSLAELDGLSLLFLAPIPPSLLLPEPSQSLPSYPSWLPSSFSGLFPQTCALPVYTLSCFFFFWLFQFVRYSILIFRDYSQQNETLN